MKRKEFQTDDDYDHNEFEKYFEWDVKIEVGNLVVD